MCKVLMVGNSGFYYWLKYPVGKRIAKQNELLVQIEEIHKDSKYRYGSPRITAVLKFRGVIVSRPRVARLMRKASIKSIVRKKYRVQTTDSKHIYPLAPNMLGRDFYAGHIGEKWVSDLLISELGKAGFI